LQVSAVPIAKISAAQKKRWARQKERFAKVTIQSYIPDGCLQECEIDSPHDKTELLARIDDILAKGQVTLDSVVTCLAFFGPAEA